MRQPAVTRSPGSHPQPAPSSSPRDAVNPTKAARVSRTSRSEINDIFGDRRALLITKPSRTPSPQHYAPVPPTDRLRMSMHDSPSGARLTLLRGPLHDSLHSVANLSSTLSTLSAAVAP